MPTNLSTYVPPIMPSIIAPHTPPVPMDAAQCSCFAISAHIRYRHGMGFTHHQHTHVNHHTHKALLKHCTHTAHVGLCLRCLPPGAGCNPDCVVDISGYVVGRVEFDVSCVSGRNNVTSNIVRRLSGGGGGVYNYIYHTPVREVRCRSSAH